MIRIEIENCYQCDYCKINQFSGHCYHPEIASFEFKDSQFETDGGYIGDKIICHEGYPDWCPLRKYEVSEL